MPKYLLSGLLLWLALGLAVPVAAEDGKSAEQAGEAMDVEKSAEEKPEPKKMLSAEEKKKQAGEGGGEAPPPDDG